MGGNTGDGSYPGAPGSPGAQPRGNGGSPGGNGGAQGGEGLGIFGPLELPRDQTEVFPAYEDDWDDGYGPPGGTLLASPSMMHSAPPPPPMPGYAPPQGPPQDLFRPEPPRGAPPGAYPTGNPSYPDGLFRPAPSPHEAYGQPQYAPPGVPPRQDPQQVGDGDGRGGRMIAGLPRNVVIGAGAGVAALVLAVTVFASGVFSSGSSGSGNTPVANTSASVSPSANASASAPANAAPGTQAQQVNALFQLSSGSRVAVSQAVQQINHCQNLPQAVQTLQQAAAQREQQVQRLDSLKVDQLSNGTQLVATLRQAWTASAQADQAFAAWGSQMAGGGCKDGHVRDSPARRQAAQASDTATRAKNQAVALWNPIAAANSLPARNAGDI